MFWGFPKILDPFTESYKTNNSDIPHKKPKFTKSHVVAVVRATENNQNEEENYLKKLVNQLNLSFIFFLFWLPIHLVYIPKVLAVSLLIFQGIVVTYNISHIFTSQSSRTDQTHF